MQRLNVLLYDTVAFQNEPAWKIPFLKSPPTQLWLPISLPWKPDLYLYLYFFSYFYLCLYWAETEVNMREVRHWLCPYVSTGHMSKIYVNEASREAEKEMAKFGGRAQEGGWLHFPLNWFIQREKRSEGVDQSFSASSLLWPLLLLHLLHLAPTLTLLESEMPCLHLQANLPPASITWSGLS